MLVPLGVEMNLCHTQPTGVCHKHDEQRQTMFAGNGKIDVGQVQLIRKSVMKQQHQTRYNSLNYANT